jgi:transcriptional regulator with XRE-family HTH domain
MVKKATIIELNRLGDVLKKKGISQYRLHKDTGISYSLINNYCANKQQPGLKQLELIARTLSVAGKDLINF